MSQRDNVSQDSGEKQARTHKSCAAGIVGNNDGDYDNCFAIMTLDGSDATVDYYTVPLFKPAVKLNASVGTKSNSYAP
jgi:hypothetical protein